MNTEEKLVTAIEKGKTPCEEQRDSLGIPNSLKNKPVLYVSSHRGFFDSQYPGHVVEFMRIFAGEIDPSLTKEDEQESAYLDLTMADPGQIVDLLRHLLLRTDPSRSGKWLPADTSKSEPPPGFIANVIYLPCLDEKGETEESSSIFGIDQNNYRVMLPKLKDFLVDKNILNNDRRKTKALTSGEKG